MKQVIADLEKQRVSLLKRAKEFDAAIKALQNVCEHEMEYKGSTHGKTLHTCKVCGHDELD